MRKIQEGMKNGGGAIVQKSTLKTPINIPSFKGVVKTTKRAVIIMPKPPPTFLFAWCKLRMIMKRKVGLCVLRSVKYAFSNSCESCKQAKFWDFFRQLKCSKPLSKIFELKMLFSFDGFFLQTETFVDKTSIGCQPTDFEARYSVYF